MTDSDETEPILMLGPFATSPADLLYSWAMETCGVGDIQDLFAFLDDAPQSREPAAGVFWYCQDVVHTFKLGDALVACTSDGEVKEYLLSTVKPSGLVDPQGADAAFETQPWLDAPAFFPDAEEFREFVFGLWSIRDWLRQELRNRVLGSLVSEETADVGLLLAAGLLTLLVDEARRRPEPEGSLYYNEDIRETLGIGRMNQGLTEPPDVWNTARLHWSEDQQLPVDDTVDFSLAAARHLVGAEYAAFRASEADYEEAFNELSHAAWSLSALGVFSDGLVIPHLGEPFGWVQDEGLSAGIKELVRWHRHLTTSPYRERVKNWWNVAMGCTFNAEGSPSVHEDAWFGLPEEGFGEVLVDVDDPDYSHNWVTLTTYWYMAYTHAKAQMSPSEHDFLRQRERNERHRKRLTSDFFDDCWFVLEENTRECLVSAEIAWSEAPRSGGRVFALPNELRLAFEGELREMFIKPIEQQIDNLLSDGKRSKRFGLRSRDAGSISLGDIGKLLERANPKELDLLALHMLIEGAGLNAKDKRFVHQDLARFLNRLWRARNEAEHQGRCDAGTMRTLRRQALGIGCEGMLPRLARLKKRMMPGAEKTRRLRGGGRRLLPGSQT